MPKTRGRIVKMFAGSNTAEGFHSFYDNLATPGYNRIFIIKGGPGTGKSTLMKRIADALLARGWMVEFFYCSSDSGSLDAIYCPALGVAMVDGTAPHVIEPPDPGAVGEVVNLGDFWDRSQLHAHRDNIRSINTRLSQLYRMAHDCLASASGHRRVLSTLNLKGGHVDTARLRATGIRLAQEIASLPAYDELDGKESPAQANPRHLFASAVTQEGPINSLDSIAGHLPHRYIITGPVGSGKSLLVTSIMQAALLLGLKVVVFHCSLDPSRLEHLYLPERGTAVITSAWPHLYQGRNSDRIVDTSGCISPGLMSEVSSQHPVFEERLQDSVHSAVVFLARAKDLHDLLESYYSATVDFSQVDRIMGDLLDQILAEER